MSVRLSEAGHGERSGRTLKTAVAVLQVLRMVEDRPDGIAPDEVALALEKSQATASYLLNSLCHVGYAYQDPATGRFMTARSEPGGVSVGQSFLSVEEPPPPPPERSGGPTLSVPHDRLREAVHELYGMTQHRSYLATRDVDGEAIHVQEMRGRRSLPTVPGLGATIRKEAHALALGKALLAQRSDAATAYVQTHGLTKFTPRTIIRRQDLADELEMVWRVGYAIDREEFAAGIWCLAVPIYDTGGDVAAALGISLARGQIGESSRAVLDALYRVAREVESDKEEVSG